MSMAASYKPAAAFVACLLISLLLLHTAEADDDEVTTSYPQGPPTTPAKIDCGSACTARCRLASRQRLCKRACGTCCARCNCVPPGTSGHQEECPCYASLTTHGGRRKCP
ncbi:snakin-2-like [Carica papaya]|uniref:snakin-2-like n=1 Tax=Carica papaya TaxID=3649 RepID=UPI000B8CBAFF|nr:snakin-2-like [Carica papaya]